MATRKTTAKAKTAADVSAEEIMEPVELDLDTKVTVKNIAEWSVSFKGITESRDIKIAKNGSARLSRNEIIAQVNDGNKLFKGVDGDGSHATIYIADKPTRIEVGFETEDTPQKVYTAATVKDLLGAKSAGDFKEKLEDLIVTRAEKNAIMKALKESGFNDYNKIMILEKHTGYKF